MAPGLRNRTAWMKGTASRRMNRRRHIARQKNPLSFRIRVHFRHGGNQRLRVRMLRRADDFLRLGRLHDFAQIHHQHAMADVLHHRQIVRDKQIRQAALLLQIAKKIDDLRLHRNIQRAHRLVADDELRLHRQRAGDADALALAAAEFVRITPRVGRIQADGVQQFRNALPPRRFAVGQMVNVQRLADDVLDGHARIQRAERVLENHLEFPPPRAQLGAVHAREIFAAEKNLARRRLHQAQDGAGQRGFAAAAFADEAERFARRDGETHAVHRFDRFADAAERPVANGKMHFQIFDFEQAHAISTSVHGTNGFAKLKKRGSRFVV